MFAETDDRFSLVVQDEPAGVVHGAGTAAHPGEESDVVLELVRVHIQLSLKHFHGGDGVCLRRVGILEVCPAAVEAVGGLEVAGLHVVVDILHIHHQFGVEVYVDVFVQVQPHAFDLFRQHGKVELGGVEAGQVGVGQPFHNLVHFVAETGAGGEVFVFDAVYGRCLRIHGILPLGQIIPGFEPPGFDAGFTARHHFHKAQFCNAVRSDIESRAFDVEEQQRAL